MSNPTYVVTGAAGFIGARFCEAALQRGATVVAVDRRVPVDAFASRPEHDGVEALRAIRARLDVAELPEFLEARSPGEIDGVLHLGACTDTMELDEAVHEALNVRASKGLWSWCARARVPLVYASSAATYGAGEHGWDDDEARLGELAPLNPYGWSKHRFDLWALERERVGESPPSWAGFKFFNVYGFGERHKGRMASVALHGYDQIRQTGKLRLFRSHREGVADGEQRRDFVCVEDVVDALFFALTRPVPRGLFNLGTGRARSFADLGRAIFAALGLPEAIEYFDMPAALRERYQYFTEANVARLRETGYARPFTSLEDGVSRYVARLRAHEERAGATA